MHADAGAALARAKLTDELTLTVEDLDALPAFGGDQDLVGDGMHRQTLDGAAEFAVHQLAASFALDLAQLFAVFAQHQYGFGTVGCGDNFLMMQVNRQARAMNAGIGGAPGCLHAD